MLLRYNYMKDKLTEYGTDNTKLDMLNMLDNSVPLVFWIQFDAEDGWMEIIYMLKSYRDEIIRRSTYVLYCGECHCVYLILDGKLCKYNLQSQHLLIGSSLNISRRSGCLYFDHFNNIIWACKYCSIDYSWQAGCNVILPSYKRSIKAYDMKTLQYINYPVEHENCTRLYNNKIIKWTNEYLESSSKRIDVESYKWRMSGGIVHDLYYKSNNKHIIYDYDLNIIKELKYDIYVGNNYIWLEYKKARDEKWDPLENCPIEKTIRIIFNNVEFEIPRYLLSI